MLARQLVIGFLAVIIPSTLLLGGVTVYSLISLDRVNRGLVEIMRSREAVADLHLTLAQAGAPLGAFLLGGDQRNRERFETLLADAQAKVRSCAEATCHSSTRMPRQLVTALLPAIERLRAQGRLIIAEGPGRGEERVETVRVSISGMRRALEPMLAAVRLKGETLIEEAGALRRRVWALTLSLSVLIVVAGAGAATVIARRISRPVSDLVRGTRRVMAGDWSYRAGSTATGEIGELASSFNRMVQEIELNRRALEEQNRTLEERVRQRTGELRDKERALARSEKLASIGLLAAGVAHELNNPLTSIVMNANLMIEEADEDSALREGLRRIDADAGRCRRIVDDLRAFARPRQIEKVRGEVEPVVEEAIGVAAHELARRGVRVERDLAADLPRIAWDPDRMVQVLTNLLVNAAHAAERGGVVTIGARSDEDWLRIEVRDDGRGIAPEHRTKIFDPFFTTKADGTGLGLSISYGIVEEHGGRIEAESRAREEVGPGEKTGTIMRILMPIGAAAA
jgi:signal transduction histidine kinase